MGASRWSGTDAGQWRHGLDVGFGLLAMTLCLPSMQAWAGVFETSPSTVQLAFSLYVVAYGGFQILFGPLSDHYGRRRILMIGLVVVGETLLSNLFYRKSQ